MYEKAAEEYRIRAPSFEEPIEEDLSYLSPDLPSAEVVGETVSPPEEEFLEYLRPETGLEQVPDLQRQFQDIVSGKTEVPFLAPIMEQLNLEQESARDEMIASLRARGIRESTPGREEMARLGTRQAAERVQTSLAGLMGVAPLQQAAGAQVFGQGMGIENTAFDQFMRLVGTQQGLDTSQRGEQSQALAMLINALSGAAVTPQMPGFQMPGASPGLLQSLGTIGGNVIGTDPQGSFDWIKDKLGI